MGKSDYIHYVDRLVAALCGGTAIDLLFLLFMDHGDELCGIIEDALTRFALNEGEVPALAGQELRGFVKLLRERELQGPLRSRRAVVLDFFAALESRLRHLNVTQTALLPVAV